MYHIYSGTEESVSWTSNLSTPIIMHQCGYQPPLEKLDNGVFAYVSHWQNIRFGSGKMEVLPHVIKKASDTSNKAKYAKNYYGFDSTSIVLGRHGGIDTWNLPFVNECIKNVVKQRQDICFLFLNTKPFIIQE